MASKLDSGALWKNPTTLTICRCFVYLSIESHALYLYIGTEEDSRERDKISVSQMMIFKSSEPTRCGLEQALNYIVRQNQSGKTCNAMPKIAGSGPADLIMILPS
jgi:hypothetical protein